TLAKEHEISPEHILITAGADEAIDRACRAILSSGSEMIIHDPTFEMISHYALLSGAIIKRVQWEIESFPIDSMLSAISRRTGIIALVTPNNPTGLPIPLKDIETIASAAKHSLILVDLTYIEFAEREIASRLFKYPNVLTIRTLS